MFALGRDHPHRQCSIQSFEEIFSTSDSTELSTSDLADFEKLKSRRDFRFFFSCYEFGLVPSVMLYGQPYRFPYVSVRHGI